MSAPSGIWLRESFYNIGACRSRYFSLSSGVERRIFNSARVPPEQCVFCRIVARRLPSYVVFENKKYIAFLDNAPFSRGHTLVCPKKHGETIWDMDEAEIGELFKLASRISRAVMSSVNADGFRFIQNNGEAANQVVAHAHVHVIPVKLEDRGKFMQRKNFSSAEMAATAKHIESEMTRAQSR
jgi:histidine triad (HIT) family protein